MPGQPPGRVFRSPCPSGASKGTSLVASPVTADHECPPPLTSRLPRRSPPINRPTGQPRPSPTSRPPPGVTPGQLVSRPTGEVLPAALTSRVPPFPPSTGEPRPLPPLGDLSANDLRSTGGCRPALTSRRHHRSTGQLPCPGPLAPRACPRRSSPANWRVPASPQLPSAPARHPWSTGQPLSFFPPAPGQPWSTGEPPHAPPGHLAVALRMSARPTGEDPTALRAAGTDAGSPPRAPRRRPPALASRPRHPCQLARESHPRAPALARRTTKVDPPTGGLPSPWPAPGGDRPRRPHHTVPSQED